MKVQTKIHLAVGLAVAVFYMLLAGTSLLMTRALISSEQWVDHTLQAVNLLNHLENVVQEARSQRRGYVLTGYEPYRNQCDLLWQQVAPLRQKVAAVTTENPHQQARLARLDPLLQTEYAIAQESFAKFQQDRYDTTAQAEMTRRGEAVIGPLMAVFDEMVQAEDQLLKERSAAASRAAYQTMIVIGIGSGLSLIVVLLSLVVNHRHLAARRRAEEELRHSQRMLQNVIDGTTDAVYVKDIHGRYLMVNSAVCRFVTKTRAEILGQDDTALFAPGEARDVMANDRRVMTSGSTQTYEENVTCQGLLYTFLSTKGPVSDERGTVIGLFGVARDITERKEVETRLTRLAAIVEFSDDAIIGKDLDGTITSWNRGAEKIFGYPAGEMVGTSIQRLLPPDRQAEEAEILERVHQGESVEHFETQRQTKDGRRIDVSLTISPIKDAGGQIIGASKILRDITERKQAEAELRDSERRLHLATETAAVGIWEWNVITHRIRWDAQMFKIYGIAPTLDGLVEYRTWSGAVLPEDLPHQEAVLQDTARRGGESRREFRIRRATDGEFRNIQAMETVRMNAEGQTEWVVGTNLDITERKRAEQALRESEHRYRTLFETMDEGFCVVDMIYDPDGTPLDYRFVQINAAFEKQSGFTNALGKTIRELVPEMEAFWFETFSQVCQTGNAIRFEQRAAAMNRDYSVYAYRPDSETKHVAILFNDITEHKQKEEKLRLSERKYRRLFEAALDGILILHAETGAIVDVNPFLAKLLGFPREDFLGRKIWEIGFFKDIAANQAKFLELQQQGHVRYENLPLETATGRRVDVEFVSNIYPVNQHNVIQCNIRDVTDRQRAEEEKRHQLDLLRTLIDHLPDCIYVKDTAGRFLVANRAVAEIMGAASPEALLGKVDADFYPPEAVAKYQEDEVRVFQGEPLQDKDEPHFDPHGQRRELLTSKLPLRDNTGKIIGLVGISRDVTERKQILTALRESEEKYHTLFENSTDAIFLIQDNRCIDCNARTVVMFGCESRDQIVGCSPDQFSPPRQPNGQDSREAVLEKIAAARAGQPQFFEWMQTKRNGTPFPVEVSLNTVTLGDKVMVQAIVRDITERRQAEEAIHQLNAELEQRVRNRTAELTLVNKELEAFSYSISHDLRAPLRSIDGFSRILLEDCVGQLDATSRDNFQRIRGASQRMSHLIDDLLKLSQVTRSDMRRTTVDLSALARAVLDGLQEAEPNRQVACVIAPDLTAEADAGLVRALLENLLGNAWKFTSKTAHARIEFGIREDTKAESGNRKAEGEADDAGDTVFFVRDNGAGFDMTYANKLFNAFQRLHAASDFPGTGIGLATVQRIVHRHHGRIWAESEIGHGATFYFTLPIPPNHHETKNHTPCGGQS